MNNDYQYNAEDIRKIFSYNDFSRGSTYHIQKRVTNLTIEGNKLSAKVRGNQFQPYNVEVRIINNDDGNKSFIADCSCPVASQCKHAVFAVQTCSSCFVRRN